MKKPIDKEYLENAFIDFDAEVSGKKYLHKDDESIHTHSNKTSLDKISETSKGTFLFNGKEITNGKSAYEIAKANGFTGTEAAWLESLKCNYDVLSTSAAVKENTATGKLVDSLVIKEVFQSVSDGKKLLASAITDKGVNTDATDTFEAMAEKICQISSGGIVIPLETPTNVTLTSNATSVTLKWTDPNDVIFKDITLAEWAGTIVVRKEGSAPVSQSDGVIVADSKIRNQYKTDGIVEAGLENGITYYYGIFPYTLNGGYNYNCIQSITIQDTTDDIGWNYTLDDQNNIITLNYYIGLETDVIVHNSYTINGKVFKTQFTNNDNQNGYKSYMFNLTDETIKTYKLKSITFEKGIDTSNVTDMNYMFSGRNDLTNLDLSCLDTSSVISMKGMFMGCGSALKSSSLNINNFNTSNVTDMSYMFSGCGFENLDLSSLDTSNVTNMRSMFNGLLSERLNTLDLSNFKTHRVTDMNYMFCNSTHLQKVYVNSNNWYTGIATKEDMFAKCGTSSVTYK